MGRDPGRGGGGVNGVRGDLPGAWVRGSVGVRGVGGAAADRGLLALGKPFYAALGHSDYEPTLADLRADESFGTPAEFGAAYAAAWVETQQTQAEQGRAEVRLGRAMQNTEELRKVVQYEQGLRRAAEEEARGAGARAKRLRRWVRDLVITVAVLLALAVLAVVWR